MTEGVGCAAAPGTNGTNGTNGVDGKNGVDGLAGPQGLAGTQAAEVMGVTLTAPVAPTELPRTEMSGWLIGTGLGVLLAGLCALIAARRPRSNVAQ
jgi:hypothetical protein